MAPGIVGRAVVALVLSTSLVLPSSVSASGPAAADVDADEVRRLFEEGRAKFDTLDYKGAIELWTQAYAQVPATEENRNIRNNLVYNIATAQEKAYDLDGDPTHLRQARGLLERYLGEFKSIYEPTPQARAEVRKVQDRIAELDARLAEAGAGGTATPTPTAPTAPAPALDPEAEAQRAKQAEYKRLLREDPELRRQYKSGTSMIAGGSVALGLGAISLIVMLAFLVGDAAESTVDGVDDPTQTDDRAFLTGAIVSGILAGGLITTGAVLVPIGAKRRKRAKRAAQERAGLALGPTGLMLRF